MSIFSERLQIARKRKGIKQKQLASQINVSSQNYNHYEKGRYEPSIEGLKALSEILEVSVDWLIGNKEQFTSSYTLFDSVENYQIIPIMQNLSYNNGNLYGELKGHLPRLMYTDARYDLATIIIDNGFQSHFKKNDIIFVNTKSTEPSHGKFYLIDFASLNFVSDASLVNDTYYFKLSNASITLNEDYSIIGEIVGKSTFFSNGKIK